MARVTNASNFATNVCIRKEGTDSATGARYLEEISFEIVNEQTMRDVKDKAEDLTLRGVRRVFAIFVKKNYRGEWDRKTHEFVPLPIDGVLEDRLLIRPIAVRALLNAVIAEHEVALALWQKGNPALRQIVDNERKEGHKEGYKQGLDDGLRRMLTKLLRAQFGAIPAALEARIAGANAEEISAWMQALLTSNTLEAVFADRDRK